MNESVSWKRTLALDMIETQDSKNVPVLQGLNITHWIWKKWLYKKLLQVTEKCFATQFWNPLKQYYIYLCKLLPGKYGESPSAWLLLFIQAHLTSKLPSNVFTYKLAIPFFIHSFQLLPWLCQGCQAILPFGQTFPTGNLELSFKPLYLWRCQKRGLWNSFKNK